MSSNIAREPTNTPWTRTPLRAIGCGSILAPTPVSTPIREIVPPRRAAWNDWSVVPGAADLDDVVDASSSGQLDDALCPVRRCHVVDRPRHPSARARSSFSSLFDVATTCAPAICANCNAKIETPPVPWTRMVSPGPAGTLRDERVPCGHGSTRQSRRFVVAQVLGDVDKAVVVDDNVVGEDAVDTARKHGAVRVGGWYVAVEPALEHSGRDTVTDLDAGDPGANLHDLAGCVRARQERQLHTAWRDAVLDHCDVAVIEGDRAYPNTRVSRPELGSGSS